MKLLCDWQSELIAEGVSRLLYTWARCSGQQHCSNFCSHTLCITIPRFRHCLVRYRSPNRLGGFLLFETTLEDMSELLHVEHTHRRAGDAGEDAERGDSWWDRKQHLHASLFPRCVHLVYLFGGVEKRPRMTSRPCMWMMPLVACKRLK